MPGTAFGDEVRRLRREAKKTLADIADVLGCSIAYVSDIERGRKNPPSGASIKKLLAALGKEALFPRMLLLAARSRQSVEISMKGKGEEVANLLVALARRCEEGSLDQEAVRQILRIIGEEPDQ